MKKRYQITLTIANVEKAQAELKVLGLGKPALSALIDDQLTNFLPVLVKLADAKRRGEQLTFDEVVSEVLVMVKNAAKP